MKIRKIDHIGIATTSLAKIQKLMQESFGLSPIFEEEVAEQGVRVLAFQAGESRLEYLEPLDEDSPVARFLSRHGEGLHHIALEVEDLTGVLRQLQQRGIELVHPQPVQGAGGKKIAFIHPRSASGVLIELVEKQ